MRNRRELNASLKGATLGDADVDTDDVLSWFKRSKKKEKELAKKRLQELENMDRRNTPNVGHLDNDHWSLIASVGDLEGVKVSHDFGGMNEGEAPTLTLKDSRILDNEGMPIHFSHPVLTGSFRE